MNERSVPQRRQKTSLSYYWLLSSLVLLLCLAETVAAGLKKPPVARYDDPENDKPVKNPSAELFETSDEKLQSIRHYGPTVFPKPTHMYNDLHLDHNHTIVPVVKPLFGKHRSDQNAIFAYAEGYKVEYYLLFLESLKKTGFTGDVVLAIAESQFVEADVVEYLREQPNVVVYESTLQCFAKDYVTYAPRKIQRGAMDIFQMCSFRNVYGYYEENGDTVYVEDVRIGRVVATIRYEWYWIWAQQYQSHSWLMLLDARDSFFQQDPFLNLPHSKSKHSGLLYFFGENAEATRLGKSRKNSNWLRNGYGAHVLQTLVNKPTICSGSTMGEQVAVEMYLRAMVKEKDETEIRMTGADQGFHNFLYYSRKLEQATAIRSITVWEQGKGIINNLGALRTKPLSEWDGMYDNVTYTVYNWDGTLSPVVHQWDRDQHLFRYMQYQRMKQHKNAWKESQRKQQASS